MLKYLLLCCCFFASYIFVNGQSYTDDGGESHLLGPIDIKQIEAQLPYNQWFHNNTKKFHLPSGQYDDVISKLRAFEVTIYLGTWCVDSQEWVPQFIKLWDELGLDRSQLQLIALDGRSELYKQGPNSEEEGQRIHRVPVFQFMKYGQEVGRIVETPKNDLLTDVAQVAFGYPSIPNYRAANDLMAQIDERGTEDVMTNLYAHYQKMMPWITNIYELNTLGNVYLSANMIDKALMAFSLNASFFPNEVFTNQMLAIAEEKANNPDAAKKAYQKILKLDPENVSATNALERLQSN